MAITTTEYELGRAMSRALGDTCRVMTMREDGAVELFTPKSIEDREVRDWAIVHEAWRRS